MAVVCLYSFTLFISALLIFTCQPLLGKMLLPAAGGTPASWIAALAFFQVSLLAGYCIAHLLSRFSPMRHGAIFLILLAAAGLALPMSIDITKQAGNSAVDIFILLAVTIGLPFTLLSAASSTLQRLFTSTGHARAADPYFLYAASNLGSLGGLLIYPFAIEPLWGLKIQSIYWSITYGLLVVFCLACLKMAGKTEGTSSTGAAKPVPGSQKAAWLLYSFIPSALLGAVTTHISTDIFSAPLMWVLPLAVYLATFIVAFSGKRHIGLRSLGYAHVFFIPFAVGLILAYSTQLKLTWYTVAFHLLAFGVTALMCHTRLAAARPQDTRQLTYFYLVLAAGGAVGGLVNAFLFPNILDRLIEYPVLLLLSLLLNPGIGHKTAKLSRWLFAAGILMVLAHLAYISGLFNDADLLPHFRISIADTLLLFFCTFFATHARTALAGMTVALMISQFAAPRDIIYTARNFFGVIRIAEMPVKVGGENATARMMYHGTTLHGTQLTEEKFEKRLTSYYSAGSPLGDIFNIYRPLNILAMGLGAGTLNCFEDSDRHFTFIEIDPEVVSMARKYFTFLSACKNAAPAEIIVGDGRMEIQRLKSHAYNLIVMDAFSSDTIPTHLLTTDALRIYLDKLAPRGMIIFNISNRYFNLAPILQRNAQKLGLQSMWRMHSPERSSVYETSSYWLVMARPDVTLSPLQSFGWVQNPDAAKGLRPWTDDYTNLLKFLY